MVRHLALEIGILLFELFKALGFRLVHAIELRLPRVEGSLTHVVFPAQLGAGDPASCCLSKPITCSSLDRPFLGNLLLKR